MKSESDHNVEISKLLTIYDKNRKAFSGFMNNVVDFFKDDNSLLCDKKDNFVIHSVKYRAKDTGHLEEKIKRKISLGRNINEESFFNEITDFCGVRVLHLRQSSFSIIHRAIQNHVDGQHWHLFEEPKAYTWDPEHKSYFESFGLKPEIKESSYTSVHYVVKPNPESLVTCEIQVRSLFEEIWGEIDHDLNYPRPCDVLACKEQLKVLAKLVGAGTRLVESVYNSLDTT